MADTAHDKTAPATPDLIREQESLREVIESISSELELRPLLTLIVQRACELLLADNGTIGLVDDIKQVVRTEAAFQMPPDEIGAEMPVDIGVFGRVYRTREPLVLDRYGEVENPTQSGPLLTYAVIGLPIFWRDRLIGVFGLGSAPPRKFTKSDIETLSLFAKHAAIAIENARLFERGQSLAALEERHRLARELHDSVTQTLFSMNLIAESMLAVWKRDSEEGERRAQRVVELSRSALAEMRSLLTELRPADNSSVQPSTYLHTSLEFVKVLGLPTALQQHVNNMSLDGLEFELLSESYLPQDLTVEQALFRIAQEAVNNVIKHANASTVRILLDTNRMGTTLAIADDGVGIAASSQSTGRISGMGMTTMRERVNEVGGVLNLAATAGGGLTVLATVANGSNHDA